MNKDLNDKQEQPNLELQPRDEPSALVTDPVCGMKVNPAIAKGGRSDFQDATYFFCGSKCKTKFDADPNNFIRKKIHRLRRASRMMTESIHARCIPRCESLGPALVPFAEWLQSQQK